MPVTTAGRDALVAAVIGALSPVFSNANAYLGVGNGTTAFAVGQTDLQGASKTRKAMDATYPTSPPSPANRITARATFGTGDANYAWEEVGLFNASSGGTMLSRLVQNLLTKTSAVTATLTYNLDLTLA